MRGISWLVYGMLVWGRVSGIQREWLTGAKSVSFTVGLKKCFWWSSGLRPGAGGGAGMVRVPGIWPGIFLKDIFWATIADILCLKVTKAVTVRLKEPCELFYTMILTEAKSQCQLRLKTICCQGCCLTSRNHCCRIERIFSVGAELLELSKVYHQLPLDYLPVPPVQADRWIESVNLQVKENGDTCRWRKVGWDRTV